MRTMAEQRSRYQIYRDKKRGGPPRKLEPCGTWAAAMRHIRAGETLDAKCEQARVDHNAEQYEKRKAKKADA